jgi:hypothetical protein
MGNGVHPPLDEFTAWFSSTNEGTCLEWSSGPSGWVALRDSKDADKPNRPVLFLDAAEWEDFLQIARGERDGKPVSA